MNDGEDVKNDGKEGEGGEDGDETRRITDPESEPAAK
jgi:hypothetical protein